MDVPNDTVDEDKVPIIDHGDEVMVIVRPHLEDDVKVVSHPVLKCLTLIKSLSLEIFTFVFMFSVLLGNVTALNLMMDKACLVHLRLPEHVCENLSNYTQKKAEVEKLANSYNLYYSLAKYGPSAVLSLFIGPWSDKNGRKPPLKLALVGIIIDSVGLLINSVYYRSPIGYIILTSIPSGLTGNVLCVLTNIYSLVPDMTSTAHRTIKYVTVGFGMGIGIPLGTLTGGLLYASYGYIVVFATAAVGHFFALLWVCFVLRETRGLGNRQKTLKEKTEEFFSLDGIRACMKERGRSGRTELWLLMVSMGTIVMALVAVRNLDYLYTHHMYNWEVVTYSEVTTVFQSASEIVVLAVTPILSKFGKVSDSFIGILGAISLMAQNLVKAFAAESGLYYVSCSAALLSGMSTVAVKARLSKIVDKDEMGKVFAVLASFESLLPLAGTAIFTVIFNETLSTFPGCTYLVAGLSTALPLVVFCWQSVFKSSAYESAPEEPSLAEDDPSVQDM